MILFSPIFAAIQNNALDIDTTQTGTAFLSEFLPRMITIIFIIGGLAFFFMFLIGAVRWITSGGDKGTVESARAQITQALAGLVVMISVWAIAKLLQAIFGINLLNVDLTPFIAK